jgi:hypothetical protein
MLWIAGIGISSEVKSAIVIPESSRRMPSCTLRSGSRTGHRVAWSHSVGFVVLGEAVRQIMGPSMLRITSSALISCAVAGQPIAPRRALARTPASRSGQASAGP